MLLSMTRFALLGLVLLGFGACSQKEIGNISQEELTSLSREQHETVISTFGGAYRKAKLQAYVEGIVERLSKAGNIAKAPVIILNTNEVNGFSLPTGHIYITRGLIALANDEAELASVIAHEMGHVQLNHAKRRLDMLDTAKASLQAMSTVLSQDEKINASLISKARLASFSRLHEEQADSYGIGLMAKAGYDVAGALRFLRQLDRDQRLHRKKYGLNEDEDNDFFSTHPAPPQRLRKARNLVANLHQVQKNAIKNHAQYVQAIDGMLYEDNPTFGLIRGARFINPTTATAFNAPRGYKLAAYGQSVQGLHTNGSAFRYDYVHKGFFDDPEDLLIKDINLDLQVNKPTLSTKGNLTYYKTSGVNDDWHFTILGILDGAVLHRFLIAGAGKPGELISHGEEIASSFIKLDKDSLDKLSVRRIKAVIANKGDSQNHFARLMSTDYDPKSAFALLNGIMPYEKLKPGESYIIVSDQN